MPGDVNIKKVELPQVPEGFFTKVLRTIESIIGVDSRAAHIEAMAKAEVNAAAIRAAGARDAELLQRAQAREDSKKIKAQRNLENVFVKTKAQKARPVSKEPVDPDWLEHFSGVAEGISRDDLQEVLARLLAGEVAKPGTCGRRTLEVLRLLTPEDAKLFQSLCRRTWLVENQVRCAFTESTDYGFQGIPELGFAAMNALAAAGLIWAREGEHFTSKDGKPLDVTLDFFGEKYVVKGFGQVRLFALSSAGMELFGVLDVDPDFAYRDMILGIMKRNGFTVDGPLSEPPAM